MMLMVHLRPLNSRKRSLDNDDTAKEKFRKVKSFSDQLEDSLRVRNDIYQGPTPSLST